MDLETILIASESIQTSLYLTLNFNPSQPRDNQGRWSSGSRGSSYVVRRTTNPESDLQRGWSAWGGQFEESPLSLAEVSNKLDVEGKDNYDIINGIADKHTFETDAGWEIKNTPEAHAAVAEFLQDELDLDVRQDPVTKLYGLRHHEGISSYELKSTTDDLALQEASKSSHNFLTGGVRAINPKSYRHVKDDIYVFSVDEILPQMDS